MLVVDGLADREIAERLFLSHHTVSQYVKRIYRKLGVDSRVGLTRVLLAPARRRSAAAERAVIPRIWGCAEQPRFRVLARSAGRT